MVVELRYNIECVNSMFFYKKKINEIVRESGYKEKVFVKAIIDDRYKKVFVTLAHHTRRNLFPYLKFIDTFIDNLMPYEDERDDFYIDFQSFFKN